MKVLTYRIDLKGPALLGSLEGDPNASTSLDYLPGSALRGALIKRYPSLLDPTDSTVRALFFDGRTRFLNGYPVRFLSPIEGQRTLPVPLSFFLEKNEQGPWYDFSMDPGDPAKAWQPAPSRFAVLDMDDEGVATAYRLAPELEMKVHTQRASRLLGRAVEGEGAVYRYESLARWQCFEAVILCDEPGVVATLRGLLPGPHRLGSALTGGYGEVEIDTLREPEKWRECGGELNAPEDGAFTLTLLSDAIVRDESGQHAATVGALLHGLRACIPNGTLSDEDAFLRPEVVGGFNRRWGLPVPQVQALKMGSVFRLRVAGLTTQGLKAVLEELEAQGIGERRAEGYGRVAVNWHAEEAKWAVSDAESPRPRPGPPPDIQLSGRDETLAGDMVKRVLGERLDRHLAARAAKINILNPPKRSQLARLRTVMRAELTKDSPDPACIREFVADVCSRQSTRAQFQNARVTGQRHVPLHEWLENAADSTGEGEWRRFVDPELQILPIRIGQIEAKVDADLRKRYLLRLVDAALSRAMKKQAGTEDG